MWYGQIGLACCRAERDVRNSDLSRARGVVSAYLPLVPGQASSSSPQDECVIRNCANGDGLCSGGCRQLCHASGLAGSVEEGRVLSMSPALSALGEQAASQFEHGGLERVFVEGGDGYMIVTSAVPEAVLAAIASKDAKLGLIFLQMGRTAEAAKETMAG